MLRLFVLQGSYKNSETHKIYKAVVTTAFADGKVYFTSAEGNKTFVIFSKRKETLKELDAAIKLGVEAGGVSRQYMLMEPREIMGTLGDFGKTDVEEIKLLYKEYKDQDTAENVIAKIHAEIKEG